MICLSGVFLTDPSRNAFILSSRKEDWGREILIWGSNATLCWERKERWVVRAGDEPGPGRLSSLSLSSLQTGGERATAHSEVGIRAYCRQGDFSWSAPSLLRTRRAEAAGGHGVARVTWKWGGRLAGESGVEVTSCCPWVGWDPQRRRPPSRRALSSSHWVEAQGRCGLELTWEAHRAPLGPSGDGGGPSCQAEPPTSVTMISPRGS